MSCQLLRKKVTGTFFEKGEKGDMKKVTGTFFKRYQGDKEHKGGRFDSTNKKVTGTFLSDIKEIRNTREADLIPQTKR